MNNEREKKYSCHAVVGARPPWGIMNSMFHGKACQPMCVFPHWVGMWGQVGAQDPAGDEGATEPAAKRARLKSVRDGATCTVSVSNVPTVYVHEDWGGD